MRKLWLSHFEPHMLQSLRLSSWSFYTLDHRKLCGPLAAWFWQPPNSGPPTLSFSRFLINRCKDRITFVKRRLLSDKPCPMISIIPFPQSHFFSKKKKKNVNPSKNHISCFGFFCRVTVVGLELDLMIEMDPSHSPTTHVMPYMPPHYRMTRGNIRAGSWVQKLSQCAANANASSI